MYLSKSTLTLIFLTNFFLYSCKPIKKEFHSDIQYFENGGIKSIQSFKNKGEKDGPFVAFDHNGKLEDVTYYLKNEKSGTEYEYFSNGIIGHVVNWYKGKKVGDFYWYTNKGIIESYGVYDSLGTIIYVRKYNDEGVFIEENGTGILFSSLNQKKYHRLDTLVHTLTLMTTPPNSSIEFYVTDVDTLNQISNPIPITITRNQAIHNVIFEKPGIYKYGYSLRVIDNTSKKMTQSLYGIEIEVLP